MGKYGIKSDIIKDMLKKNRNCSYCNKKMIHPYDINNRKDSATIEHLNYDGPFYIKDGLNIEDIVIVCTQCNSSRGIKKLKDWFNSRYCINNNINEKSVSEGVKDYIKRNPNK